MNIEDLTIGQARELASMFGASAQASKSRGLCIVVADRGFVYVGYVTTTAEECEVKQCRNIRYWGTERGLAQLVNDGPTSRSKIDDVMTAVSLPMRAVISIHPVEVSAWKKLY